MKLRKEPDLKLKEAMAEVQAVMKKHDVMGCVVLSSRDAMEYIIEPEATWSCAHLEKDERGTLLRVRTTGLALTTEQKKQMLEDTLGAFFGFVDVMSGMNEQFKRLLDAMDMDMEHQTKRIG
jgi:hypothetical protein